MEVKGFCSTCENAHRDAIGKLCCFKYKYEGHLTPENGYCHDYKPEPDMDYAKQIGEMGLMDLYSEQCDLEIAITALEKQMQFPTLGELHRAKQMVDCEMNARDGELIVRRCDGTDRPQGSK